MSASQASSLILLFPGSNNSSTEEDIGFIEDVFRFALHDIPEVTDVSSANYFRCKISAEGLTPVEFTATNANGKQSCICVATVDRTTEYVFNDYIYEWGDYLASVTTTKPIRIQISYPMSESPGDNDFIQGSSSPENPESPK